MKWIVSPNIVEVEIDSPPCGFSFSKFNSELNKRVVPLAREPRRKYQYRIGRVDVPSDPDFTYGYYLGKIGASQIYYRRPFGPFDLKMSYDIEKGVMTATPMLAKIPIEFGKMWPAGLHLSNIIIRDLLLMESIIVLHGCVLDYHGKTICLLSPSRTGKSTMVKDMLDRGASYICEDFFLTDGESAFMTQPNGWKVISKYWDDKNIKLSSRIDEIVINYPHDVPNERSGDTATSLIMLCTLPFFSDYIIKASTMFCDRMQDDYLARQEVIAKKLVASCQTSFISEKKVSWDCVAR